MLLAGAVAGFAAMAAGAAQAAERLPRQGAGPGMPARAADRSTVAARAVSTRLRQDLRELADSSTQLRWKAEPVAWARRGTRKLARRSAPPIAGQEDPFEQPMPSERVARPAKVRVVARPTSDRPAERLARRARRRTGVRRHFDSQVRTVQLEETLGPPDTTQPDATQPEVLQLDQAAPDGGTQAPAGEGGTDQPTPLDNLIPEDSGALQPPAPLDDEDVRRAEADLAKREECHAALEKLKSNRIHNIGLDIGVPGRPGEDFPIECALSEGAAASRRSWPETVYTWKASAVCHKPLYFQELALERYGHSKGPFLQPLVSGAHFFAMLPILPYQMGLRPPKECVYALGHYRPGSCAPYLIDPIPLSVRAGLLEAGAVVGASALVP